MKIPVYNCLIDDIDETTGIYAISFVDCPANETDFVALNRQANEIRLKRDNQKQILTGVVLKPEQLIYRHSPELGDYYIKFTAEQIEKIAQKMMRTGIALHNTNHQHTTPLQGNYLTELWIVEDPQSDKSRALGFTHLPKGTLMCSYKIGNNDYWNSEVLTGNVKGFSLEGFFNQQITITKTKNDPNKTKQKREKMNKRKNRTTLLGKIVKMLTDIETVKNADATQSGQPYIVFTLAEGTEIYVDQDAFATLDGEQAPAGEHKLADGNIMTIDEQGQFIETKEPSEDNTNPEETTAPQTLRRKRKQKFETIEPEKAGTLKDKIAEMQTTIEQLTKALDEAQKMLEDTQGQVEELRRKTPSARPAMHKTNLARNTKDMTTAERMAFALNQTIQRKNK